MLARSDEGISMPPGPMTGAAGWYGRDMAKSDEWILRLGGRDLEELDQAIRAHEAGGLPMGDISRKSFVLPTLGRKLDEVLNELLHGRGFVLVRGFPVERYSLEQTAIGYLGLGSYFGSFRSQNAKGHLLGHVKDLGLDINKPTTRFYQTSRQLKYHTDSCDIVGLLCLKTAKSGGESGVVSSVTIYNEMLKRRPELLALLFRPFPTDRRGEIPVGMKPWFDVPVFSWHEGELSAIYAGQYIISAQKQFPEARRLSAEEFEALKMFDDLADDPQLRLLMEFKPGDMQFLHNHQTLHSRTDFEDWPEVERRRHLLRLWLAPPEGRPLPSAFAARYGSLTPGDRGGIITKGIELKFALAAE